MTTAPTTPIEALARLLSDASENVAIGRANIDSMMLPLHPDIERSKQAVGKYFQGQLNESVARCDALEDAILELEPKGIRDILILMMILSDRSATATRANIRNCPHQQALHKKIVTGLSRLAATDADALGLPAYVEKWWRFDADFDLKNQSRFKGAVVTTAAHYAR